MRFALCDNFTAAARAVPHVLRDGRAPHPGGVAGSIGAHTSHGDRTSPFWPKPDPHSRRIIACAAGQGPQQRSQGGVKVPTGGDGD